MTSSRERGPTDPVDSLDAFESNPLNLHQMQREVAKWMASNFPEFFNNSDVALIKLTEELGELAEAHGKQLYGDQEMWEEYQEKKIDAVGDIVIVLISYCTRSGIDFQSAVEKVWTEVGGRDYRVNKIDG